MIRILHLGDCHFDDTFYLNKTQRRSLLETYRDAAFRDAVKTAVERQVDLVVFAGDLLDGERRVSLKTRTLLEQSLETLKASGIEVAWMTGNHDPGDFLRTQQIDQLLERYGVHLFDGPVKTVNLWDKSGLPYRLVGSGHERKGLMENRLRTYPVKEAGRVTIGLLHGMLQGAGESLRDQGQAQALEATEPYFPCTRSDLARLEYDLICMGHVHVPVRLEVEGSVVCYAGSLLGLSHKETGPRGVWLHTVETSLGSGLGRSSVKSEFLPLAGLVWKSVQMTVSPDLSLDDFVNLAGEMTMAPTDAGETAPYLTRPIRQAGNREGFGANGAQIMLRLTVTGMNDKVLSAVRYDLDSLREWLCSAAGAADLELRSELMPERMLELQRSGDTFAAYLKTCLEDPAFMAQIWSEYARRALTFETGSTSWEAIMEPEAEGINTGESEEILEAALKDLWPRWMPGSRRNGGGRS